MGKAKRSNCLAWFLDFAVHKKARGNAFDFVQRNPEYNHQFKKDADPQKWKI